MRRTANFLDDGMMIIEHLTMAVRPGDGERLANALAYLSDRTLVLRGCLSCRLSREIADEGTLDLEVRWASKDDLIRHLQSETYKQFLFLMELSAAPPTLQFFSVKEMQGLELVRIARSSS
jgi:quinol monooxygenase YgiN